MHSEDEDLARAIALSIKESGRSKKPEVISLDSDDEGDEDIEEAQYQADLQQALKASQIEIQPTHPTQSPSESSSKEDASKPGPSSFLSERAKLEKERLERQKRLRKEMGLDVKKTEKRDAESDSESDVTMEEPPTKRQHLSAPSQEGSIPSIATGGSSPSEGEVFWDGELRQTATRNADPRKDGKPTFRLTQVLGNKSELAFAILSSYSLDFPWIYQFFDPSVPVIMVAQPDATGRAAIKYTFPNWIKTTPPLRGGFGCQHMKFMLLFYKTGRLRVVISSANLIAYDWRDMENSVWVQDMPLRFKSIANDTKADDFASVIQQVLRAVNVPPALKTLLQDHPDIPLKVIEDLRIRWDWSKVRTHLVASIAGKHEGWPDVIKTGHPRLMMVVRKMGLRTGKGPRKNNLIVECQGSSLGNFTTQWVNEFYWSARGESAEDWLDEPKKRREKLSYPPVKIVFPTKQTVQASALGEPGGGTIFCRRRQWTAKNFPRDKFFDSKSKGGLVLMHSKMIVATKQHASSLTNSGKTASDTEDDGSDEEVTIIEPAVGWAYVGSHNFTPSAWGTLSGSVFNPVLNITNYEIGIVFPLKDETEVNRVACFERPPRKYTAGLDEPWIQEESIYHQPEAIEVE